MADTPNTARRATSTKHLAVLSCVVTCVATIIVVGTGFLMACGDGGGEPPTDFEGYYQIPGRTWFVHIERDGDAYTATGLDKTSVRVSLSLGDDGALVGDSVVDPGVSWRLSLDQDGSLLVVDLIGGGGGVGDTWATLEVPKLHGSDQEVEAELAAQAKAREKEVEEGIRILQAGVQSWAVDHGDRFPKPEEVTRFGDVGMDYVDRWPENPYTDKRMEQSDEPGDYTYERLGGGASYELTGYFDGGGSLSVP